MSRKNHPANTIAAELARTRWDYSPGQDRTFLLDPVGRFFHDLPWETKARHLGPARPVEELKPLILGVVPPPND